MKKTTVLHIGDPHLDGGRYESLAAWEFAIATVEQRRPDLVAIPGDFQERVQYLNDRSGAYPLIDGVRRMANVCPVVGVYGNHDPAKSLDVLNSIRAKNQIWIMDAPDAAYVESADGDQILVAGIPYPYKSRIAANAESDDDATRQVNEALIHICQGFAAYRAGDDRGAPFVVLFHGNISGCQYDSGQTVRSDDVLIPWNVLEDTGADYVALNHIHKPQALGSKSYYAGSTYHNNFGETGRRFLNWVTISDDGVEVEQIEIPLVHRLTVDLEVYMGTDGTLDWTAVQDKDFPAMVADLAPVVKLRYKVPAELADAFDPQAIVEDLIAQGARSVELAKVTVRAETRRADTTAAKTWTDKVRLYADASAVELTEGHLAKVAQVERLIEEGGAV